MSSPLSAQEWPDRGPVLAGWLNGAVDDFHTLVQYHGTRACVDSLAWCDEHTLVEGESRIGSSGAWFALLTLGGTAELLRSLSVLYRAVRQVPLTRGYVPIVRSIQEHLGRVIWLCEPGTVISGPGDNEPAPTVRLGCRVWDDDLLVGDVRHAWTAGVEQYLADHCR